MKKILFMTIVFISILFIYLLNKDTKYYYLALGDEISLDNNFTSYITNLLKKEEKYETTIVEFARIGYRTTDLLNDIENNKKVLKNDKTLFIRNAIIKADLITISMGMNDFINYIDNYNFLRNNIVNLKNDMNNLLKEIRRISKEKIILIGIYKPKIINEKQNQILQEINNIYKKIADNYNIYYIDIYYEDYKDILNHKLINLIKNDII